MYVCSVYLGPPLYFGAYQMYIMYVWVHLNAVFVYLMYFENYQFICKFVKNFENYIHTNM